MHVTREWFTTDVCAVGKWEVETSTRCRDMSERGDREAFDEGSHGFLALIRMKYGVVEERMVFGRFRRNSRWPKIAALGQLLEVSRDVFFAMLSIGTPRT